LYVKINLDAPPSVACERRLWRCGAVLVDFSEAGVDRASRKIPLGSVMVHIGFDVWVAVCVNDRYRYSGIASR
jgi:hypothetical protein